MDDEITIPLSEAGAVLVQNAQADPAAELDRWLDSLRNTRFSRDTRTWNTLHTAYVAMKTALAQCPQET